MTPSSMTSRREPRKWPQMAALRILGFGLRAAARPESTPGWPVASTIDLGADDVARRRCRSAAVRSPSCVRRTPTARSPSKTTSSTRHAAMDFDAFLRRVVEQKLIELRPLHVPRAAALARVVLREQKRRRLRRCC